jgi:hypothetical protein
MVKLPVSGLSDPYESALNPQTLENAACLANTLFDNASGSSDCAQPAKTIEQNGRDHLSKGLLRVRPFARRRTVRRK